MLPFGRKGLTAHLLRLLQLQYEPAERPDASRIQSPCGVYINIPAMPGEWIHAYMHSLGEELARYAPESPVRWLFIGGDPGAVLPPVVFRQFVEGLRERFPHAALGVQMRLDSVQGGSIASVRQLGFIKLCIDTRGAGAVQAGQYGQSIGDITRRARSLGMFVNIDLLAGLPGQTAATLIADTQAALGAHPSQIHLLPAEPCLQAVRKGQHNEALRCADIEPAAALLTGQGYTRRNLYCFTQQGNQQKDLQEHETADFYGFGAQAYSNYNGFCVVNPPAQAYAQAGEPACYQVARQPRDGLRTLVNGLYNLRMQRDRLPANMLRIAEKLYRMNVLDSQGYVNAAQLRICRQLALAASDTLPFPAAHCIVAPAPAGSQPL